MIYFAFMYLVSDTAVSEQAASDHDQVASVGQPDDTASALGHAETTIREQPEGEHRKHCRLVRFSLLFSVDIRYYRYTVLPGYVSLYVTVQVNNVYIMQS